MRLSDERIAEITARLNGIRSTAGSWWVVQYQDHVFDLLAEREHLVAIAKAARDGDSARARMLAEYWESNDAD